MNDAIGREDARARQWSAANASIEGSESVVRRSIIKASRKNKTGPGLTRQVLDEALWVWKCERLRCGGVMPREHSQIVQLGDAPAPMSVCSINNSS